MMELIHNGGPVMWLLLACGIFALVVFLERVFNLHRAQIKAEDFLKGIYNILRQNNIVEAVSICEETPGPVAHLALSAVLHHDDTLEDITRAIEDAGLAEIPRLERGLGGLATIARITPLIGLLGTVLGMMDVLLTAFTRAPLVQAGDVMEGIWHALIATAFSLMIAILVYAGYNLLVSRVEAVLLDMERASASLMAFMKNWKKNGSGTPA